MPNTYTITNNSFELPATFHQGGYLLIVIKGKFDMKSIFFKETNNFVSRLVVAIRGLRPANLDSRVRLCVTSSDDSRVKSVTSGNDICCLGRSMIEMLGVLAIIGVLSVAGIAGYSKAMTKWKINKTIEQIEHITHGIFTAYANQKKMDYINSSNSKGVDLLKSLGIISEDMIVDDELRGRYGINLKNPFGGDILIMAGSYYYPDSGHYDEKNVSLEYINIPREACMALGSLDWAKGSAAVIGVGIASDFLNVTTDPVECWLGNYLTLSSSGDLLVVCNNGVPNERIGETEADRIPLPIPPDIVAEHCNCPNDTCFFSVAFTDK